MRITKLLTLGVFLMISVSVFGQKADTALARTYFDKAQLLKRVAKYDSAAFLFDKAAKVYKKATLWPYYFDCKVKFIRVLLSVTNTQNINTEANNVLKELKKIYSKENYFFHAVYMSLITLKMREKKYGDALVLTDKCLKIGKMLRNKNPLLLGNSLLMYGNIFFSQGRFTNSIYYYKKSLKHFRIHFGTEHAFTNMLCQYLGATYTNIGAYDLALEYYFKSLSILGKLNKKLQQAEVYQSIGSTYIKTKAFQKALSFFEKANTLQKAVFNNQFPDYLLSTYYTNIGVCKMGLVRYKEAIASFRKSLKIIKDKEASGWSTLRQSIYESLATIYLDVSKLNDAFKMLTKVENLTKSKHYFSQIRLDFLLSEYYKKKGEKGLALRYAKKFINRAFKNTSENIIDIDRYISSVSSILDILLKKYNKNKNLKYLEEARFFVKKQDQILRKNLANFSNKSDKLSIYRKLVRVNNQAIKIFATYYSKYPQQQYQDDILRSIEHQNANLLLYSLNASEALKRANVPAEILEKELLLKEDITFYKKQTLTNPKKANQYQDSLFKYNRQYEALIAQLEKDYPKYVQLKYQNKIVSLADVQSKLNTQTALLEYAFGADQSYLMLITKTGVNVVPIAAEKKLTPLMNAYYEALANESGVKAFSSASYKLYEALLKPAEKYLQGKSRLLVIAPSLESIPFEALISQKASATTIKNNDFSQLNYLIKRFQVSYHYSATLWHRGVQIKQKITPRLLALAPFSTGKSEAVSTRTRKATDPLPESGVEVKKLFNLFNTKKLTADIYLAKKATKARFVNNAKDYSILHIASHSSASTKNADLAKIRFAPDSDTSKVDGLLYSGEVYNLSLNADLLVLSSCESGVGKLAQGEGVLSLARSFLYAGARNIVFSLWDVNDTETRKLMEAFYTNFLNGQNYRVALQKAQQSRIKADKNLPPKHWAGFIMIGE